MKKVTYDIGSINSTMRLKISFIIDSENNQFQNSIEKYNIDHNIYIKIQPKPFITIEIGRRKDNWEDKATINLNRYDTYCLDMHLRRFIKQYVDYSKLYYYNGSELNIDKSIANHIVKEINLGKGKAIRLEPTVVERLMDGYSEPIKKEGCIFSINSLEHSSLITYGEMQYLEKILHDIDMDVMAINMMQIVLKEKEIPVSSYNFVDNTPIVEKKEVIPESTYHVRNFGNTIPDEI